MTKFKVVTALATTAIAALVANKTKKYVKIIPKAEYDEMIEAIKQRSEDFYYVRKMYIKALDECAKYKALSEAIKEVIGKVNEGESNGRTENRTDNNDCDCAPEEC